MGDAGYEAAARALDDLVIKSRKACVQATDRAAGTIASRARVLAPHYTGYLASTIQARPAIALGQNRFTATIEVGAKYGRIQEFGGDTRGHGEFMAIQAAAGPHPDHFALVRDTHIEGRHYMRTAIDQSVISIQQEFIVAYTAALEE